VLRLLQRRRRAFRPVHGRGLRGPRQAPGRAIHGDPPCAGAHGPGARAVRRMGASAGSGPMRPGTAATAGGLLLAVALMALNLRPFIAGIGPLAADIAQDTGLGLKGVALLTLVPML